MTITKAKTIIFRFKKMPYEKRIKVLCRKDWDFINTLNKWLEKYPAWQEVTPHWAKRLTEIDNLTPNPKGA